MKLRRQKKGQIWISVILYVLIVTAVITLILRAGIPLLNKIKDRNSLNKAGDTFLAVDEHIREVAKEGAGSQRVVSLEIKEGELVLSQDNIALEINTKTKLVEPRSSIEQGNLKIITGTGVTAIKANDSYLLENNRIRLNITSYGNKTNFVSINTTRVVNFIQLKETGTKTNGKFSFFINNDVSSNVGTGYTELLQQGNGLGFSTVLVHVNSTSVEYDLDITLETETDFFIAEAKNVVFK